MSSTDNQALTKQLSQYSFVQIDKINLFFILIKHAASVVKSPVSQVCEVSLVTILIVDRYCCPGVVSPGDDHLIIVRDDAVFPFKDKVYSQMEYLLL